MKKGVFGILIVLICIGILIFVIFPKTGFAAQSSEKVSLETLKLNVGVECLQDSQCSEDAKCLNNLCINKKEINTCEEASLSTPTRKIKVGESINSIKGVLTKTQLPYLLSGGELVEVIDNKAIEYFYSSFIIVGNNNLERESESYSISNGNPIYTYQIIFSNGVDFSNKNIQGQKLRIFGEEYTIGSNSDNSKVELISDTKTINLQEGSNMKITKDENGNVIMIEIDFSSESKVGINEDFADSTFNSIKLSVSPSSELIPSEDNFVEVKVGGVCG